MNIPFLSRLWARVPGNRSVTLTANQWRWATEEECWDVYVPDIFHGEKCERGIAAWRVNRDNVERRDSEIEWIRLEPRGVWMPARRDLDPMRLVIFDGIEIAMASTPGGGIFAGTIAQ